MTRTLDARDRAHAGGGATRCPDCTDGLGQPRPVEPGSWRDRVRRKPGLATAYRVAVFFAGLLFVLLGLVLTVLPGAVSAWRCRGRPRWAAAAPRRRS